MTALLVVVALLAQTPDPVEKKKSTSYVLVPLVNYSSDLGFGFGVAGEIFFYGEDAAKTRAGYSHLLQAQVMFTTGGVQSHFLTYDGPHLLGPVRLEAHVEFNKDLYAPFYGPGNQAFAGIQPDPGQKFDSYEAVFPVAFLRLRFHPLGEGTSLEPYIEYRYQTTQVDPYAASVLTLRNPLGIKGGKTGQIMVGLFNDTRDAETNTTSGGLEEIAFAGSGGPFASDYTFVDVTVSERRFFRLGTRRLVLGLRAVVDTLVGQVPFFEWSHVGGIADTEGMGGINSVRGLVRNRYTGNVKVFGNAELRFLPVSFEAFGSDIDVGGVIFYDIGRVWHPGVTDGPADLWHPAFGGGLRFVRGDTVIRLDYARDIQLHHMGFYFAFGQMF